MGDRGQAIIGDVWEYPEGWDDVDEVEVEQQ